MIEDTVEEGSSLELLKKDMRAYQILSNEKQIELFKEYEITKNPKIRELLINSNLPLVLSRAKKALIKMHKCDILDMFQDGAEGLIKAVDNFDCHRGVAFSTYATPVIDTAIDRSDISYDRVINLPPSRRLQLKIFIAKETALMMKLKKFPTIKEIAAYMGLSTKEVEDLLRDYQDINYLNDKINTVDDERIDLIGTIADDTDYFSHIDNESTYNDLFKMLLKVLSDRELIVIILRYGLVQENPLTNQDIADILHCKRQRISKIEVTALEKLKYYYETKSFKKGLKEKTTIRVFITEIDDLELINIINTLNEYDRNLLYKRYNENLTKIINNKITLNEFRYIFRVIVPRINYMVKKHNDNAITLKKIR